MFLSSYRNTSGGSGEREMLWEPRAAGECFHSFFEFSQTFTSVSITIETRRKYFLFRLENSPRKITENEENLIVLFIIKTYILYTTQFIRHNLINQLRNRKHFPCFYRVRITLLTEREGRTGEYWPEVVTVRKRPRANIPRYVPVSK